MTGVPKRRGEGTEIHAGGDGVTRLQTKEHQGLLGATGSQKEASKGASPESSERAWPCQRFDFELLSPGTMRK